MQWALVQLPLFTLIFLLCYKKKSSVFVESNTVADRGCGF
jgi:hypothetical protein